MGNSSRVRNVLIVGGNFYNQGAYLMLTAAARAVKERLRARPILGLRVGDTTQKAAAGAGSLLSLNRVDFYPRGGKRTTLRRVKDKLPVVFASDIDAVLDVSGFALSDQWSHLDLRSKAERFAWWSNEMGVPVYLLPQAFGPFEQTAVESEIALTAARFAFPRDPESLGFVTALLGDERSGHVVQAPDFTVLLSPDALPPRFDHLRGAVPIVPNWNIAQRCSVEEREQYIENLARYVRSARDHGLAAYGLCHEGARDLDLLKLVDTKVNGLEIVAGVDGLESKALLGVAAFTVSGRFHALVSALSQGVPAVTHGWSHKYKWLAEDFDVVELLRNPYEAAAAKYDVELLLSNMSERRQRIGQAATTIKHQADQMWRRVEQDFSFR